MWPPCSATMRAEMARPRPFPSRFVVKNGLKTWARRSAGIPSDLRAQVFKPFFTTKREGNGLGLAISARIIAEHGGHIGYRCPPDGGTIFTVTLQQARSGRAAEHAA